MAGVPLHPTGIKRSAMLRDTAKAFCMVVRDRPIWVPRSHAEFRQTADGDELFASAWIIRDRL